MQDTFFSPASDTSLWCYHSRTSIRMRDAASTAHFYSERIWLTNTLI
jgi:hypothetical protein